jgi:hypothetical protein
MEITNWKKKLEKGLFKEIKHSVQIALFLKVTWCPENAN